MLVLSTIVVIILLFMLWQSTTTNEKETVMWFHRPSCPHCVRMQGEWSKLIKSNPRNVIIRDVNIEQDRQTADQYNVESVPFIIKIKSDGRQMVYNGDRTLSSLLNFAENA